MNRAAVVAHAQQFRRAGVDPPPVVAPWLWRWYGKLALLGTGAGVLTAAFAPLGWFPLAWVGLVPWLLVLSRCRGGWSAFGWSWVAGTLFFIANMWWMSAVTVPGMVGLMAILGLYWGYAGVIAHGAGLVGAGRRSGGAGEQGRGGAGEQRGFAATNVPAPTSAASQLPDSPAPPLPHSPTPPLPRSPAPLLPRSPTLRVLLMAAVWVAASEWFRGTWPWHGLPWLYLGYTQSPALVMCQSADLFGVAGLSFVIVAANAWVAFWLTNRLSLRRLVPAGLTVLTLIGADLGYGVYRLRTEPRRFTAGPTVMVVQPNYPQSNTGDKGATADQIVDDHLAWTMGRLGASPGVDLVVWSETMMPPLNAYAREYLRGTTEGPFIGATFARIQNMCYDYRVALLTGGGSVGRFDADDAGHVHMLDRSNVAYAFDRHGRMDDQVYRKIHLVPFGEFIPFKEGCPPLYKLALKLGPKDMADYELTPGSEDDLTVFELRHDPNGPDPDAPPWRYVTPICFEDIDADICAQMFRPPTGGAGKRADVMVNVTNDGWFMANENGQHLQAAVFRSIENRVSTARAVNTGVSGFIDPLGRTGKLVEPRTNGTSVDLLQLDGRVTLFTRTGQLFARCCAGVTVATAVASVLAWVVRRRRANRAAATAV